MSGPRHRTVVGRPNAVRLAAFLLLSGLFLGAPFSATANAQNAPATRTAPSHPFAAYIEEAAQRFGIPAAWIRAVMRAESAGDVRAISSAGAMGLMQIMPDTWAELRVRHRLGRDPYDPRDNILAGAAYLREMYDRYGNVAAMLAAYNAGPARYGEYLATGRALPAETRAYVAAIAPVIGRAAPASTPGTPPDWRDAPLFTVQTDGNGNADSDVVERPTDGPSAAEIAPQSDGLFVAWTGAEPSP